MSWVDEQAADLADSEFDFEYRPETDQSFENALAKARNGDRLSVDDGIALLTTGTDSDGIEQDRKERVLEVADRRRAEIVGRRGNVRRQPQQQSHDRLQHRLSVL